MSNIIPNISVDCVIFGFDSKCLKVLLVERTLVDPETNKILIDDWTLTGFHISDDEDFDAAAARILKNLSGLDNIYLEQFYAFGGVDRVKSEKDQLWLNSRYSSFSNRIVTIGYYALINSSNIELHSNSERNLRWFPVSELPELGYDHRKIIDKALETLRHKLIYEQVGFELLPEKFSMSQLRNLYETILGTSIDRRNFRRKMLQNDTIEQLEEKQSNVKHKHGFLYRRKP